MKYNNFRVRSVTVKEANLILELLKSYKIKIIYVGLNEDKEYIKHSIKGFNYSQYAIVEENDSNLYIETRYYEPKYKATRYECNLNGEEKACILGIQAFNNCQKYCYRAINAKRYKYAPLDRFFNEEKGKYECSASPIINFNPKYERQELHDLYEYDINSAYSSIMLDKMPDTWHPYYMTKLKKNQVGFFLDEKCTMVEKEGAFVEIAFDLIELTAKQKEYIIRMYNKKADSKDAMERKKAKLNMNASIGYYQRWNPFVRSYIVNKCNERIRGLLDDDSVLWNTDAIVSLKRRPELELGASIGLFKETYIKRLVYIGNNYQIDLDLPKYRGVPKAWFKDGWDMLIDPCPKRCNKYLFDQTKTKLIENKEFKNGKKIN